MTSRKYAHVKLEQIVDGGYSGPVTVTAADGGDDTPTMVFLASELMEAHLVLSASEAVKLGEALIAAGAEGIPPYIWDLKAFKSQYGTEPPAEHARTLADLKRHVRALSDVHEAEKAPA